MTKRIKVGNLYMGGGERILVQSMTNVKTADYDKCIQQIIALEEAGCDIIRVAIPDEKSADAIAKIKPRIHIPLVADIHFDYKLALKCMENGVDKIRINPGNIGEESRVREVARMADSMGIPIRIGVNGGSLEKEILKKYKSPTPEAMVESARGHVEILNKFDFDNIVISLKASNVKNTIEAYRLASKSFDYPLHLGVTEAGTFLGGTIKSSIGIGSLLADGIGDTIRVSLTDDPIKEVEIARELLKALNLIDDAPEFVSCPTCARCNYDMIALANKVEEYLRGVRKKVKVAVMGCAVNGPGEAREADIGVAGGKGEGLLFKKGEIVKKIPESQLFDAIKKEIDEF